MINWLLKKFGFLGNTDVDPGALIELESNDSISFSAKFVRESGTLAGYASDDQPFNFDDFVAFIHALESNGEIDPDNANSLLQAADTCIHEMTLPECLAITNMILQQHRNNDGVVKGSVFVALIQGYWEPFPDGMITLGMPRDESRYYLNDLATHLGIVIRVMFRFGGPRGDFIQEEFHGGKIEESIVTKATT